MFYCLQENGVYVVTDEDNKVIWSNIDKLDGQHFSHFCHNFMNYANDMDGLAAYLQSINVIKTDENVAWLY